MNSLNNLELRTQRLETLLLPKEDYLPDLYDFLFMAEQTIPGPPDVPQEEEILQRLGPKADFINNYRID